MGHSSRWLPLYVTSIVVAGGLAYVGLVLPLPFSPTVSIGHVAVWVAVLGAGFAATELVVIRLRYGSEAIQWTLMEVPLVLGLFFLPGQLVMPLHVIAAGLVFAHQRRALQRAAFNLGLFALESSVAVVVWHAIVDGRDPWGPWGWLGVGAAICCTSLISSTCVAVAIALATRTRPALAELVQKGQLLDLVNASFALVIASVVVVEWRAVWLVGVIAATLVVAYRAQELSRQRAAHLERLAAFSDVISRQSDLSALLESIAAEIAETFSAQGVHLQVDANGRRAEGGRGDPRLVDALRAADELDLPAAGLLVTQRDPQPEAEPWRSAIRECLAVPLISDDTVVGRVLVANRGTDVTCYTATDLTQLRTFATNAAVAVDNVTRSARLVELAGTDELTGLANRRVFGARLLAVLDAQPAAVVILDLDRFQDVNDTVGHQVGDLLLRQVGARLQAMLPEGALAARFGGDAFAVLLPGVDVGAAEVVAWRIHDAVVAAFVVDDLQIAVETSIGVAVAGRGGSGDDVVRRADLALYAAKDANGVVEVYRPEMDRHEANRLNLLAELRDVVTAGELGVHFQPKLNLASGLVDGVEALARWTHPVHGPISPDEFVPLAERSQLITPLSLYVLRHSLAWAHHWRGLAPDFTVSINVSPRSLREPDFVDKVAEVLAASETPAEAVTLEITETSLLASPEAAIAALWRLRRLGLKLSVDDFGTGYSSLSYLQRLPVDEIKLDRSFLVSSDSPHGQALLEGVVDLCHRLGKTVVAEGVEEPRTVELLRAAGCDLVQGYLVARPMPAEQVEAFLARVEVRAT